MKFLIQNYNINDLEQLSGIKAHTIRVWEKRYSILFPKRSKTNSRVYDTKDLQKILNISLLKDHGYKISRIAKFSDAEIVKLVEEVGGSEIPTKRAIHTFKVAMFKFDQMLFHQTFEDLEKNKTFSQIFHEILMPLLEEIGNLWETNSINVVHQHFFAGLLREKLYLKIGLQEKEQDLSSNDLYILFLPEYEIHEVGLLYLNYELKLRKQRTIFLSPGLSIKNIKSFLEIHSNPVLVSYLTLAPNGVVELLQDFKKEICTDSCKELLLFGAEVEFQNKINQPSQIKFFKSISEFVGGLDLKCN